MVAESLPPSGSAATIRAAILSPAADTGGQGARFADAAARVEAGLQIRSVFGSTNYMHFPSGERWDYKLVEKLFRWADVLHAKSTIAPYRQFDRGRSRPVMIHHHGTAFREMPQRHLDEARHYGAVTAVSTIDLLAFAPRESFWLPSPQHVDWLAGMRRDSFRPSETIRVVHAPSSRRIKDTALFLEVMAELERKYNTKAVVVEGQPWKTVLKIKATEADIYYDQLQLGYGQNALEAWAMGVPVVVGAAPEIIARMRSVLGELPFVPATPETFYGRLEALITSEARRQEEGAAGLAYVRQYHDYPRSLERLRELYEMAIAIKNGGHRYPWQPDARRGARRRVGPGQWQVCIRTGMWTNAPPAMARRWEADQKLGEPLVLPATGPIAEAIR